MPIDWPEIAMRLADTVEDLLVGEIGVDVDTRITRIAWRVLKETWQAEEESRIHA